MAQTTLNHWTRTEFGDIFEGIKEAEKRVQQREQDFEIEQSNQARESLQLAQAHKISSLSFCGSKPVTSRSPGSSVGGATSLFPTATTHRGCRSTKFLPLPPRIRLVSSGLSIIA
ncbi:hypothetical protein ACH5RR_037094 [Cinchona calisaya]|uniref:Uncharacterized protein n=1 Tax=Cinchona calisaya TaxID=153742 RepID=A0ABD2Y9Z6_9GENT